MPLVPSDISASARAAAMASWLAASRPVHGLSMALVIAAGFGILCGSDRGNPAYAWWVVLAAGIVETWYASRVAFDHAIFSNWAARWKDTCGQCEREMAEFDASVRKVGKSGPRDLESRMTGAAYLLLRQYACLLLQFLSMIVGFTTGAPNVG